VSKTLEEEIADATRFERAWSDRLGGKETEGMRWMVGIALGLLIHSYKVDPQDLIAYIKAVLEEDGVPPPLKSV
jgi:hypothetical protein